MSEQDLVLAMALFVGAIVIAALVAIVSRRTPIPYTVALVVVGLIGGWILAPSGLTIPPDLVLLVLLPGLVFEAAYRIEVAELRRTFGGIVLLAAPGVLVTAIVVAAVLYLAADLPPELGFVAGAMVAATDPAAVIATFKRLDAPTALSTLVDGESLFNDGTGIVVFTIAVGAVTGRIGPGVAIGQFVLEVAASTIIGVAVGYVASRLLRYTDDHLVELTISVAVAYGTYLAAQEIGLSGIIATVLAGVVLGNYGRAHGLSQRAAESLDLVWEFIAFLSTALAFLLVGIAISIGRFMEALPWIGWAVGAVLVGRALAVYLMLGGTGRLIRRPWAPALPMAWLHVLFWAGLRGAVAVVMALSIPLGFPQRELLQEITFGVVLFTLIVQGTSIDWVMRATGAAELSIDRAAGSQVAAAGSAGSAGSA